ncbi:hypothetical protein [Thermonema sp.]|uniref:hypothetical protein n=1 Tax=Thermonema sp. TaxID=2231181 RepID=UPI0025826A0D|nr:hypothetical protein [Thermonema sp.]
MESGTLVADGAGYLPVANLRVRNGNSAFGGALGRVLQVQGNAIVESGSLLDSPGHLHAWNCRATTPKQVGTL